MSHELPTNSVNVGAVLQRLNETFYDSYDTEYWFTRATILRELITNSGIRRELTAKLQTHENEETVINRFKVDLHFLAYHSVEALFALVFALSKLPQCPWIWLTGYHFTEYSDLLEKVATKGLRFLGIDTKDLFYDHPKDYPATVLHQSASVIEEYLKLLALDFSDKADYNSFKHGLRTMRAAKSTLSMSTADKGTLFTAEELVTTFLELQRIEGSDEEKVKYASVSINSERSFRIIEFNTELIRNLIHVSKAKRSPTAKATEVFVVDPATNVQKLFGPDFEPGKRAGFKRLRFDLMVTYRRARRASKFVARKT